MLGIEDKAKLFEQMIKMFEKKMAGEVKSKFDKISGNIEKVVKGLGSDSQQPESDSLVGVVEVSDKDKAKKVVLDIVKNDEEINPALADYKDKLSKKSKSTKVK